MAVRRTTLEFDVARDQWSAFLEQFNLDHRSRGAVVEACTPSASLSLSLRSGRSRA